MRKIMKAALAVCLVVVVCIGLTACGKSEEVKNCEKLIKEIGADITLDSCEAVGVARLAYEALCEDDAKKVDTSALDAAEEKLLDITGSPFQACKELMGHMKDPSSFRIYGNVVLVDMTGTSSDGGRAYFTVIDCDAKNGWGAYNGKSFYEAMFFSDKIYFVSEDDEKYIDFSLLINPPEGFENPYKDKMVVYTFSGKRIAELIGCEYMG